MPELAEVEYYRKQWNPGLGKIIKAVRINSRVRDFRDCPVKEMVRRLPGRRLEASQAHGKQMVFQFEPGAWLGVHLGMTGKLRFSAADPLPDPHAHLVLALPAGWLVFSDPRQFGKILFEVSVHPPHWWTRLPPEILSRDFTLRRLKAAVKRHRNTSLKSFLLMQRYFPGVGNWMADEILWRARLDPRRTPGSLDDGEIKALFQRLRWVCRQSLRIVGDHWGEFPESWLFRRRWKEGSACPKTRGPLVRERIGGRTTCWSPQWQK